MPLPSLTTLLTGAYFRPPAKQILASLPSASPLILRLEPDNPYDPSAIQVWVDFASIPEAEHLALDLALAGTGFELSDFEPGGQAWDEEAGKALIHLGYVAASGGKPILKSGKPYPGNQEFLAAMAEGQQAGGRPFGRLGFDLEGKPLVTLDWEAPEEAETEALQADRKAIQEI